MDLRQYEYDRRIVIRIQYSTVRYAYWIVPLVDLLMQVLQYCTVLYGISSFPY